jgi:hypothetical protein
LRRWLADTPKEVLIDRVWLAGDNACLRERLAALEVPMFPLHGRDLRNVGVPAGPPLGALLRELRDWWLDGGCIADKAACRAELERRLAAR